jgi:hypothetical protein
MLLVRDEFKLTLQHRLRTQTLKRHCCHCAAFLNDFRFLFYRFHYFSAFCQRCVAMTGEHQFYGSFSANDHANNNDQLGRNATRNISESFRGDVGGLNQHFGDTDGYLQPRPDEQVMQAPPGQPPLLSSGSGFMGSIFLPDHVFSMTFLLLRSYFADLSSSLYLLMEPQPLLTILNVLQEERYVDDLVF